MYCAQQEGAGNSSTYVIPVLVKYSNSVSHDGDVKMSATPIADIIIFYHNRRRERITNLS